MGIPIEIGSRMLNFAKLPGTKIIIKTVAGRPLHANIPSD
jgi:hypothetical protein